MARRLAESPWSRSVSRLRRPSSATDRDRPVPRPLLAGRAAGGRRPPGSGRRRGVPVTRPRLAAGLTRLFPDDEPARQRWAAATAVLAAPVGHRRRSRHRQDDDRRAGARPARRAGRGPGGRPTLVGLAAPTGKAAARLEEAVHAEARQLDVAALRAAGISCPCAPRPCTDCSGAVRTAPAGFAITATTGCRTT